MRLLRRTVLFATLLAIASAAAAHSPTAGTAMKIKFTLNGIPVTATLDDNQAAQDFAAMLPLTLTLTDYAATEKIADLPGPLSTAGSLDGIVPKAGDVTYYVPWGNLALFHKDFRYSAGLVRLGRIDQGFEALAIPGGAEVIIELIQER